jgi:hypothetical protein
VKNIVPNKGCLVALNSEVCSMYHSGTMVRRAVERAKFLTIFAKFIFDGTQRINRTSTGKSRRIFAEHFGGLRDFWLSRPSTEGAFGSVQEHGTLGFAGWLCAH